MIVRRVTKKRRSFSEHLRNLLKRLEVFSFIQIRKRRLIGPSKFSMKHERLKSHQSSIQVKQKKLADSNKEFCQLYPRSLRGSLVIHQKPTPRPSLLSQATSSHQESRGQEPRTLTILVIRPHCTRSGRADGNSLDT